MKISIVTINYNNAEGLRRTMESVFAQTYTDYEYIVVDGASTDGSVDVIREYDARPKSFQWQWVSEPDTGIYNAMNKGIRMARGEYILMLNSADTLVDSEVLNRIAPMLDGTDIIQGNVVIEKNGKMQIERGYGKSDLSLYEVLDGHFLHQASFISAAAYTRYGLYDDQYKKAADTYFYIRTLALGTASFKYVDVTIANFDTNGISAMADPKWVQIDREEDARFYGSLSPRIIKAWHEDPKKIALYDTLHRHKLIWKLTMLLKVIAEKL